MAFVKEKCIQNDGLPFKAIDLTHPITASMPTHAYDEPMLLTQIRELSFHHYTDYQLTTGMHVGTHIDGPAHMLAVKTAMADIPLDRFVGAGYLVDARGHDVIEPALLKGMPAQHDLIVLVLTGSDRRWGRADYFQNHPVITEAFAQQLIDRTVKMLGIDMCSPDHVPFAVHKLLLAKDILIAENLTNLDLLVGVKDFTVAALPLKMQADSAPARVVAFQ